MADHINSLYYFNNKVNAILFFKKKIVTLSKFGHIALDLCHPYITYILRSFVIRDNAKNVDGTIQIL